MTTFVNGVTLTDATWFNDVERLNYTIFGNPANIAAVRTLVAPKYTSADQTITAGGSLTLAHSLGATPVLISLRLKNTSTELGYSANDEVFVAPGPDYDAVATGRGLAVVPDATNITIRFGSAADTFTVVRKDTGAVASITNAKWSLIVRAWIL